MKLRSHQRIDIVEAEIRALDRLSLMMPVHASMVADAIWPDHEMKPQGAGAAASRILKRLEEKGLAKWTSDGKRWGWLRANPGPGLVGGD